MNFAMATLFSLLSPGCSESIPGYVFRFSLKAKLAIRSRMLWTLGQQGQIQHSPLEGAPTVRGLGAPTYEIAKFCEKLHEIEKISGFGGGGAHCTP